MIHLSYNSFVLWLICSTLKYVLNICLMVKYIYHSGQTGSLERRASLYKRAEGIMKCAKTKIFFINCAKQFFKHQWESISKFCAIFNWNIPKSLRNFLSKVSIINPNLKLKNVWILSYRLKVIKNNELRLKYYIFPIFLILNLNSPKLTR